MTHGGRILRHRDQGTCRALRALRLNSNVDSVLSREWRFNDYKSNYKDWEAELTAAVGLSVWVGSLDPDLGPQVPGGPSVASSCASGPEDVTPTGGSMERGAVNAADVSLQLTLAGCLICEPVSGVVL